MWLYGSGFPKSMNIGLAIDKKNGCSDRGHRIAVANRYHPDGTLEPNGEKIEKYEGRTEEGKQWQGWGTALKPAYEPIIVARKPIEKSVADNVLKYGVGGINIDECRIYDDENISCHNTKTGTFAGKVQTMPKMNSKSDGINIYNFGKQNAERIEYTQHEGRFPANIILTYDDSDYDEVCGGMPNTKSVAEEPNANHIFGGNKDAFNWGYKFRYGSGYTDEGSAARYFYCAKASKKDRDEGLDIFEEMQTTDGCIRTNSETARKFGANSSLRRNTHPTVKPAELMQYLVRLVNPKSATILDCFMGSGSTGKAVMFENRERNANYKFIGIEMTEEYLPIAKARIEYARDTFKYDIEKIKKETGQLNIFNFMED